MFCDILKNNIVRDSEIQFDSKSISPSNHVKHLEVVSDQNLTYPIKLKLLFDENGLRYQKNIYSYFAHCFGKKPRTLYIGTIEVNN